MTPFFFGSGARRLFGLYTPAHASRRAQRAVVLCHPWGAEYLRAHRSFRFLAVQLAQAGVHVLRFDYFGSGDSAGEMAECDLKGWRADIETAIEELKDTSGVTKVGLIGLRFGATLALQVAAKKKGEIDNLIVWDPVVAGGEYLREIRAQSVLAAQTAAPVSARAHANDGGHEQIMGFDLTDRLAKEIEAIDVAPAIPKLPARTLVLLSQPLPSHAPLRAAASLTVEEIDCPRSWVEDKNSGVGAVPTKLVQRIVQWFE